jgi:hypothetical protein
MAAPSPLTHIILEDERVELRPLQHKGCGTFIRNFSQRTGDLGEFLSKGKWKRKSDQLYSITVAARDTKTQFPL